VNEEQVFAFMVMFFVANIEEHMRTVLRRHQVNHCGSGEKINFMILGLSNLKRLCVEFFYCFWN
jgi:hypothetical protein